MRHFASLGGLLLLTVLVASGCQSSAKKERAAALASRPAVTYPSMGKIERFDAQMNDLIPVEAQIEKLAEGFDWSEGPVWVPTAECLLFSDVPRNTVYRWHELGGLSVCLKPSGFTGPGARGGESGANGLTLDAAGRLVLCQHGDRRVARWDGRKGFTTLAGFYKFLRFNSPNDLAYRSSGDLYFTDPPYGLEGKNKDPKKELVDSGVYRLSPSGEVTLMTSELTFPNGIAFSPDESLAYVAVSDPANPVVMAYPVKPDGTFGKGRVFFNAKPLAERGLKGLPDGLKVDEKGNVFSTGPGGVMVLSPQGLLLGLLNTGEATANCAWGNDGTVLYITADSYICRVRTRTRGPLPGLPQP